MMRSAVATGLVDFILRAEEIPAKLAEYFDHVVVIGDEEGPKGRQADIAGNLGTITRLLHARTGHDFSDYKDRTIIRRVQRRMNVLQIDKVSAFIERLRQDSRETRLLFQDLLIGVTSFFRDPEAFAALEREVIPELFKDKGAADTVRVWVPGCATGEEAYAIAILLREYAPTSQSAPKPQIFATDIDEYALETARMGRYPATIAGDIPLKRLERYFIREDGTYRIASDVGEICLFLPHNLLRDAPFSRLDLVSCRNLLIYLNNAMQDRVIPLFDYALAQNGFLFLGTSENVTRHSRLFTTVDKAHRIFRKRAQLERRVPEFPLTSPGPGRRAMPPASPRVAGAEITPIASPLPTW
jgi:two-component system, chemotaxis family, CheB/CheR fusion protein